MDPVVHFEMAYDDANRVAAFYKAAFGWNMKMLGEPMAIPGIGDYVAIKDSEGNRVGMLEPLPMPKAASKKPAAKKSVARKKPSRMAAKKASRR